MIGIPRWVGNGMQQSAYTEGGVGLIKIVIMCGNELDDRCG